jgi:hypothetical protein
MTIGTVQFTCIVCGNHLPDISRQELREKGCALIQADGSEVWHCVHHSNDEIRKATNSNPVFVRASNYQRKLT